LNKRKWMKENNKIPVEILNLLSINYKYDEFNKIYYKAITKFLRK
jgi:hypothetical protein